MIGPLRLLATLLPILAGSALGQTIADVSFSDNNGKSYSLYAELAEGKTFVVQHVDGY